MKTIHIRVIPNAKKNSVAQEDGKLKVHVNAPAIEGKANEALREILAEFFNTKKKNIAILKGEKSKDKIVEVNIE